MSLISGVVVATALTLVVIPLLYYMYLKTVGDRAGVVDPVRRRPRDGRAKGDETMTVNE